MCRDDAPGFEGDVARPGPRPPSALAIRYDPPAGEALAPLCAKLIESLVEGDGPAPGAIGPGQAPDRSGSFDDREIAMSPHPNTPSRRAVAGSRPWPWPSAREAVTPSGGCRPWLLAAVAVVAMLPFDGAAVAQMSTIGAHSKQPFPTGLPRPLVINIGFYLIDFARVNGREESFDLQGYLTASWVDPGMARPAGEPGGERRFAPESLWSPNYEFTNAAEQVKIQNEAALVVADDGRITQRFRFVGKFSWPMDLRRFPFDTQMLTVLVEPFERETSDLHFVVNDEQVGRLTSAFLTDWTIEDVDAKVVEVKYPSFRRVSSRLVVGIRIRRQFTFYLWRVLLPLTLLVVTSWVVYRFDPTNLQPLISTTIAILLNVILFNFSVDFALPKVSYLTFIDSYAVTCFFFMLAAMYLVTMVHATCNRRGPEAARALQAKILRRIPLAFLCATVAQVFYFLG